MTERNAYSADEIAKRNGVCRAFVWKEMKLGRLAYRKVGARRLILAEDERAWLRGNVGATLPARLRKTPVDARRRQRELNQ